MKADLELVEDVKAGNQLAFAELVNRHQNALHRVCYRFMKDADLAEDVVQDAFVKAYQKLHSFEARSSFKSWLFQIAVNTAKNKLRQRKGESVDIEKVQVAVDAEAHTGMEQADLKVLIQKYVDILPDKQKTALILRVYEDLSFKEIAKIMKCPYDTAKANYRHALIKLRHKIAEDENLQNWHQSVEVDSFGVPRVTEVDS